MPDFSVYITVINKTGEVLKDLDISVDYGYWAKVAKTIKANSQDTLQLKDFAGFSGTEGTFAYNVCDQAGSKRSTMGAYQTDPFSGGNKIKPNVPAPEALYNVSFRARVEGGTWKQDRVDQNGHPVYVEYTFGYQKKRYRFELRTITATSDHPVRNTKDQLIVGRHMLWSYLSPSAYSDGTRGSLQPNIFAYKFDSSVPAVSILNVTVRPLDIELIGAQCLLYGTVNGKRVLQSDYFIFKSFGEVTVQAHVVYPDKNSTPFAWNADVEWGMELALSKTGLECIGPRTTRLELYWIATTTHRAFKQYIPVGFLRNALQGLKTQLITTEGDEGHTHTEFQNIREYYALTTQRAWQEMNKIYDTIAGASAFGMNAWGGIFYMDYYMASSTPNGPDGTLYRHVNCMDQAARVELGCSLMSPTSWLVQQPFGYINTTHLVGVANNAGALINVNNPFYGTEQSEAMVNPNSLSRTSFNLHVYVGGSKPFAPATDAIYDACGGPHLGTENIQQFIASSIDVNTMLYQRYGTHPGSVQNVVQGDGVTGINGQFTRPMLEQAGLSEISLPEALSQLSTNLLATNVDKVTHVDWAHVPTWVQRVLGHTWDVRFGKVSVCETGAQAFWHLADSSTPDSPIRVHVRVVSVLNQDGSLDIERSVTAAGKHVRDILASTMSGEKLWTLRILDGLGEFALQYADGVAAGRFVLIARNVVMDIAGMSSNEALQPHAIKLLEHTMRRDHPPFTAPVHLKVSTTLGAEHEPDTETITVTGIDTRFSVLLKVDHKKIVTAGATCDGINVLFDQAAITDIEGEDGSEADFLFVARKVGEDVISMYVADSETMVIGKKDIRVKVVEVPDDE